jgi:hypothetical protein
LTPNIAGAAMDARKIWATALAVLALAAAVAVLAIGSWMAAAVVGGLGVIAAVAAGALWVSALVKNASEHAMNKEIVEERRRSGETKRD